MMKSWRVILLPALLALMLPAWVFAQISVDVSVGVPPPELPVYDQPPIPADGYIWTPGYWAWDDDVQDYYWVPGTWVPAPEPEYLWTPGYWGAENDVFLWHAGYWGPHVGFYGGVNYGYGYGGTGYEGGYWQGGHLYYNRSVNNISNVQITNVYNKTVINNVTINRVSYNGANGIHAQPNAAQLAAARDRHIAVTPTQQQHFEAARNDSAQHVSQNNGHPPVAATARAGAFTGAGVVPARGSGALSVVHSNPSRPTPAAPPQYEQRAPEQRAAEPRNAPEPRAPEQRAPEPRAVPETHAPVQQVRPAAPPAPHPAPQPHAAAHPPEHEQDHEHH